MQAGHPPPPPPPPPSSTRRRRHHRYETGRRLLGGSKGSKGDGSKSHITSFSEMSLAEQIAMATSAIAQSSKVDDDASKALRNAQDMKEIVDDIDGLHKEWVDLQHKQFTMEGKVWDCDLLQLGDEYGFVCTNSGRGNENTICKSLLASQQSALSRPLFKEVKCQPISEHDKDNLKCNVKKAYLCVHPLCMTYGNADNMSPKMIMKMKQLAEHF